MNKIKIKKNQLIVEGLPRKNDGVSARQSGAVYHDDRSHTPGGVGEQRESAPLSARKRDSRASA